MARKLGADKQRHHHSPVQQRCFETATIYDVIVVRQGNRSQLPQTDPRDALRPTTVLRTRVDAQCDKLATVIVHISTSVDGP